jgi:predicted peroxiredoxin
MNRAAMAVNFGHRVLKDAKKPTTIFLNVDGVRLANKNIPQNTHVNGKTIQDMLQDFMADGGEVIICPMCMKNVGGMKQEDLLKGVMIGGSDITWPALFAEDVTVLSY